MTDLSVATEGSISDDSQRDLSVGDDSGTDLSRRIRGWIDKSPSASDPSTDGEITLN
jgi:hypothetical protein